MGAAAPRAASVKLWTSLSASLDGPLKDVDEAHPSSVRSQMVVDAPITAGYRPG
jgi:hypothetical protein